MKINKSKPSRISKIAIAIGVLIILVFSAYLAYAYKNSTWPFPPSPSEKSGPTEQEKQAMEQQNAHDKQNFLDKEAEKNQYSTKHEQTTTTDGTLPPVSLSAEQSDDQLVISTNLSSIPSGTCNLTVSKGSQIITRRAQIIYTPEYSTCAGFSIDTKELSRGIWNISLVVKSGDTSIKKSISYELQG